MLKRSLFAVSLLAAITLTMAIVPGAWATSLKWESPYTLDCSSPGFLDGGTSATGVVNLYNVNALIATVTESCTGSNVVSDAISTDKVMPTSYELWVYIYAGSTLEATCYSGVQSYYPNILYCSSSIYGGATLTLYAPTYKSLKWQTQYTLDCSSPGLTNVATSVTGVVNLHDVNTVIATVTASCTDSNVITGLINTKKVMPISYELWVYIYAGSTLEATCYSGLNDAVFLPYVFPCISSIYGGATLTLYAPSQA